ncbi:apolipoprotein N-acyltransferase [Agromyces mediolanus]|uniref:apolipoprotein N-acyltransferase n=1 Tax=Agromyces mediolanus TaxID=41986 RepID=UPI00383549D3
MLVVAAAAAGGLANALAFPGAGWWPLAFVGTPLLLAAMTVTRFRVAVAASAVGGAVFWGTHVFWLTVYLGPAPWLALAGLETMFFVVGAAASWAVWRVLDRSGSAMRTYVFVPVAVAAVWAAREWVTGMWPYGGFGWGKLAYAQSESPFADLAGWTGITGMSFLLALVGAVTVQVIRQRPPLPVRILGPAALLVALALVPAFPLPTTGSLRVGAVQGNSEAGLLAVNQPGRILDDHLLAAAPLLQEDLDLLVLPENAADLNPLERADAAAALDELSRRTSAPVVVGTITETGDDMFNSALVWEAGTGASGQYDKKHPVPFAEYIPDRDFWYPLAPGLFSLIPRDFALGERSNVLELDGVLAGVAICYDIVDDALIRDMIAGGAQLIVAPTNNADFGRTDQSAQQLAIARLRAIETGRSLVNVSTVGVSAMIGPDGRAIDRLAPFAPGAMVNDVPLATATTPAILLGPLVDALLVITGAVLAAGATFRLWRGRARG